MAVIRARQLVASTVVVQSGTLRCRRLAGGEALIHVAIRTGLGRRLVEKDGLAVDLAVQLVATGTGNILVGARQGETGISFMIEAGRYPAGCGVTIGASGWRARAGELTAVRILMAPFTVFRCVREAPRPRSGRSRVALGTGHRTVRARQRKFRPRVVKPRWVPPRLH